MSEIKNEEKVETTEETTFFQDVKAAWDKQRDRSAAKKAAKKAEHEAQMAEAGFWLRHKKELVGGVIGAGLGAASTYYALNKQCVVEEVSVAPDVIDIDPVDSPTEE